MLKINPFSRIGFVIILLFYGFSAKNRSADMDFFGYPNRQTDNPTIRQYHTLPDCQIANIFIWQFGNPAI
ncbi:MAG TPA: hypothetical protein DCL77_21475 [Prolixibacteraceae bacterium]|nr:hypothetical protein [Prolixibacteraceae bacterium]